MSYVLKYGAWLVLVLCSCIYSCGSSEPRVIKDTPVSVNAGDPEPRGKQLFMGSCAACHSLNNEGTGPALKGVIARWGNDTATLALFITNAEKFINTSSKNDYAYKLYERYYKTNMPPLQGITDADMKSLIRYINGY